MLQPLAKLLGQQLGRPSGLVGRVMGLVLDHSNRRINATAVELLEVGPSDDVLEVGFGGGGAISRLTRQTSGVIGGDELSEAMLARARRRFRREVADRHVDLRPGEVAAIPFAAEGFDRVLSVNTIYFLPDPSAGLAEILRVLRPGAAGARDVSR